MAALTQDSLRAPIKFNPHLSPCFPVFPPPFEGPHYQALHTVGLPDAALLRVSLFLHRKGLKRGSVCISLNPFKAHPPHPLTCKLTHTPLEHYFVILINFPALPFSLSLPLSAKSNFKPHSACEWLPSKLNFTHHLPLNVMQYFFRGGRKMKRVERRDS